MIACVPELNIQAMPWPISSGQHSKAWEQVSKYIQKLIVSIYIMLIE